MTICNPWIGRQDNAEVVRHLVADTGEKHAP